MKTITHLLLLLTTVGLAVADRKADLDDRIRNLAAQFESMQRNPDKAIPAEILGKAHGLVLLDRTKAGFLFAYQGGGGVALARDEKSGLWSAPAFLNAREASLGFQAGGEHVFYVILLMTPESLRLVTAPTTEFAGEARGTAGNASAGADSAISPGDWQVLVYSDRRGFYGGAALNGNALSPDEKANYAYYSQYLSVAEILSGKKVKPTEPAAALAAKIVQYSKEKKE